MYFKKNDNYYGLEDFKKSFYGKSFNQNILGASRTSQERIIGSQQSQISRSTGKKFSQMRVKSFYKSMNKENNDLME